MQTPLAPFHAGLFWHAMVQLLGREPDQKYLRGFDGYYSFLYEPQDKAEEKKFIDSVHTLCEWLKIFELTPLESRCVYGRLPNPQKGQEGKDYLDICIAHPVQRKT
jgi:hypothetical protein